MDRGRINVIGQFGPNLCLGSYLVEQTRSHRSVEPGDRVRAGAIAYAEGTAAALCPHGPEISYMCIVVMRATSNYSYEVLQFSSMIHHSWSE
jgi:hypothetical protein